MTSLGTPRAKLTDTRQNTSASASAPQSRGASSFPATPSLTVTHLIFWMMRRLKRRRVSGTSMAPTLNDGQEVLIEPLRSLEEQRTVQPGDIVLIEHPIKSGLHLIKRCSHWDKTKVCVLGDNAADSTDSRHFGTIQPKFILGKIVCTFP